MFLLYLRFNIKDSCWIGVKHNIKLMSKGDLTNFAILRDALPEIFFRFFKKTFHNSTIQ